MNAFVNFFCMSPFLQLLDQLVLLIFYRSLTLWTKLCSCFRIQNKFKPCWQNGETPRGLKTISRRMQWNFGKCIQRNMFRPVYCLQRKDPLCKNAACTTSPPVKKKTFSIYPSLITPILHFRTSVYWKTLFFQNRLAFDSSNRVKCDLLVHIIEVRNVNRLHAHVWEGAVASVVSSEVQDYYKLNAHEWNGVVANLFF